MKHSPTLKTGQHAREDLQAEVVLVAESVSAALDRADLVVQTLDEAKRNLVVRVAVGHDAMPMRFDHGRELLIRLEALPFERVPPILEEASSPAGRLVVPQLLERLLEKVCGVQSFVGVKEQLQTPTTLGVQVSPTRQERVLLAFDEASAWARQACIFALANFVQGLLQMSQHVKLIVEDLSLRGISLLEGGVAERFPHIHHREPDFARFLRAQPGIELVHAGFGSIFAAEPNRPAAEQVADHDAVTMARTDADLVNADDFRRWLGGPTQLLRHVLLVELFDRLPIQMKFVGDRLDSAVAATPSHEVGETLRVKRIVGDPVELFGLHPTTPPAKHPPHRKRDKDPLVATRQVADQAWPLIVEDRVAMPALSAGRFFRRRRKVTITAKRSPKTPRRVEVGAKPGNRYTSRRCRVVVIALS